MAVSGIFSAANQAIEYLKKLELSFSKNAIVDYEAKMILYRYIISLGNPASKGMKYVRRAKSKLSQPMEIGEVEDLTILGLPANEDLSQVITKQELTTEIDISKLFEIARSAEVLIKFNKSVSEEQLQSLIPVARAIRNPIFAEGKPMQVPIEIVIDQGRYWKSRFDEFKVVNIRKRFSLNYTWNELDEILPEGVKEIIRTAKRSPKIPPDLVKKIALISRILAQFATDSDIATEMQRTVSTDSPGHIAIEEIKCSTKIVNIYGLQLVVPDEVAFWVSIDLNAEDLAISANIGIDTNKMKAIIRRLALTAENELNDM